MKALKAIFLFVNVGLFAASLPTVNDMVLVEGGTFVMGDVTGSGNSIERPAHQVTVSSFSMGMTEVTRKQFLQVLGLSTWDGPNVDNSPIVRITLSDAMAYCAERSRREGLRPVYVAERLTVDDRGHYIATWRYDWSANGYRLPTEAEWEYAAKGGRLSKGYFFAGSSAVDDVAWFKGNSGNAAHPVASKRANELGLYDMSGNVWELVDDRFVAYSALPQQDPRGPPLGFEHVVRQIVVRGGSYQESVQSLRLTFRGRMDSDESSRIYYSIGFRVVRSAK
jgi:formylglycine-generating enzyme